MNIIFSARSIDVYQKSVGNLVAIAILGEEIAKRLEVNLGVGLTPKYETPTLSIFRIEYHYENQTKVH